ncbi:pyridoxal-dependent decarboxylase [Fangia hongkongensis]|uniref:pyridoxal-dependent decarboxylase n=1 Tax=Fangia hongkongensis TaxID=270495 RepID=UPI0003725F8D|nr:pyridoxal-dependent decarboxylase [Fangia hongkongensis]MBK2126209.1 hypothetical protein [Fangia hongkongensis]
MDKKIKRLEDEIRHLKALLLEKEVTYKDSLSDALVKAPNKIPTYGFDAREVKAIIDNESILDFNPKLNTSSYVNVLLEQEEEEVALMGLKVNLADQTVYPESYKIHNTLVNMVADLWHCPKDEDEFKTYGMYAGACTVGSTEACLLAGLALKYRWRKWYAKHKGLSAEEVLKVRPNIVISSCYQAAWEKLIKYIDIDCKLIKPSYKSFSIDADDLYDMIDEHTIAVVAIMGNHYGGQYDPVWAMDEVIEKINERFQYQVGIHIDAASGGFIAPFQKGLPAWDFRLKNVLSISASGHKYGESCCGTGWIIWRRREGLSEHVATSVTYLGGQADSYTLNFSRPASGVYVQYYKFLRYGLSGYQKCCESMMFHAKMIRDGLKKMRYKDQDRFILLDHGDEHCLPVVTAMLNPACGFKYNDIDLQHALSLHHWYVGGYKMAFHHPETKQIEGLFHDQPQTQSMFRVVIKSNISSLMVEHLLASFEKAVHLLDSIDFKSKEHFQTELLHHKEQRISNHC